jgi:uncharacterized protein (DUF2249 family)
MGREQLLDVRDMELPEPLMHVLASLEALLPGEYLRILSHRDPLLLYPMLDTQGFKYATHVQETGSIEILVWRTGDVHAEEGAHAVRPSGGRSPPV